MAKSKAAAPIVTRIIAGVLPSNGAWIRITLYADKSIRIERPYCIRDPRKEMPVLTETDWTPHRFTIGLLERGAWYDFTCAYERQRENLRENHEKEVLDK